LRDRTVTVPFSERHPRRAKRPIEASGGDKKDKKIGAASALRTPKTPPR
jgi:hypothetical protein